MFYKLGGCFIPRISNPETIVQLSDLLTLKRTVVVFTPIFSNKSTFKNGF